MMSLIANTSKMEVLLAALKRLKKKVEEVFSCYLYILLAHMVMM